MDTIALLSYFTMHSEALPGSLARYLDRQPCPAVRPKNMDTLIWTHEIQLYTTLLHLSTGKATPYYEGILFK
jgi:hypothetical protein